MGDMDDKEINVFIKKYLKDLGIVPVNDLESKLIDTYGRKRGISYVRELDTLYSIAEKRIREDKGKDCHVLRQTELVDFFNQNQELTRINASYYDWFILRKVMGLLYRYRMRLGQKILDFGCGNGVISCFLKQILSSEIETDSKTGSETDTADTYILGLDVSKNAISMAERISESLALSDSYFMALEAPLDKSPLAVSFDTVLSIRTFHENVPLVPVNKPDSGKQGSDIQGSGERGHIKKGHIRRGGIKKKGNRDLERLSRYMEAADNYAKTLSGFLKPGGRLFSFERVNKRSCYDMMYLALERAGLFPEKETGEEFLLRSGDDMVSFGFSLFVKDGKVEK